MSISTIPGIGDRGRLQEKRLVPQVFALDNPNDCRHPNAFILAMTVLNGVRVAMNGTSALTLDPPPPPVGGGGPGGSLGIPVEAKEALDLLGGATGSGRMQLR